MPLTNAYKDSLLNALLRAVPFTGPASIWVSIHSADPGSTGVAEITAVGRKQLTFKASSNGVVAVSATVEFTNMPAVNVSHVCLWTASSGGSVIWSGLAGVTKTFGAGDSCMIKTDALTAALLG